MSEKDPYERWRCGYCGTRYVVPNLARDCEARHEREE